MSSDYYITADKAAYITDYICTLKYVTWLTVTAYNLTFDDIENMNIKIAKNRKH